MGKVIFEHTRIDKQGRLLIPQFFRELSDRVVVFQDTDYPGAIVVHFPTSDTVREVPLAAFRICHIDPKGRIFIPARLRRTFNLPGEVILQFLEANEILVSPCNVP
jgi:DNA-binding transcriptional regulator/RsmH inhibitor MraZ